MLWLGYALDLSLRRGFDYETPSELNSIIRGVRFTGCTGFATFDKTSNDRSYSGINIIQNRLDEETKLVSAKLVLVYNPLSVSRLVLVDDFIWSDGTSTPPSDTRVTSRDCAYPAGEEETSQIGLAIVCCSLFGFWHAFVNFLYKLYQRNYTGSYIQHLRQSLSFTQSDYLQVFIYEIGYVQAVALGPKFKNPNRYMDTVLPISVLNFDYFIDVDASLFYQMILAYSVLALVAVLIVVFYYKGLNTRILPKSGCLASLKSVVDTICPLVVGPLLICSMYTLFEVVSCT
jgi:hypothetical protein